MPNNQTIIENFIAAWQHMDANALAAFFAEDGVYHNIPAEPVTGRAAIAKFIAGFTASWTHTDWEIINIASAGDLVFCERVDRTRFEQGAVDLPCVGVFELRDGQIQVWRDYFDMGTFLKAMA